MTRFRQIHSLAFRQAKTVFMVSVLLGLCFSLYQAGIEFHQEQQRIKQHYQIKLQQHYDNASQAAYHLNHLLAEQVATSLMADDAIVRVQLVDDFGDDLTRLEQRSAMAEPLVKWLAPYFTPDPPLFTSQLYQPGTEVLVGTLAFEVDGTSIARDFIAKIRRVLLFDLLRNILLTSILLVFFYRKLSRPLTTLIGWVRTLPNRPHNHLPLPALDQENEISELASSFHALWREREQAETKLNQLAYYDSLTGLANRSLLLQMLTKAIEQAEQHQHSGVLFYLDLDRFKTINDSLGHTIGDRMITAIATRLRAWAKQDYICARIGGDEFVVLIPALELLQVEAVARQLLALISNPYNIDDHQLYCSVSIGIATFPSSGHNNVDVLRQADTALYRAKVSGRGKYVFYEPEMRAQVESFLQTEKGLHEALNHHQFELYYQPQLNTQHQIIGVEALIRWHHPQKGLQAPGLFMPVAEETGQILPIGNWIIEQAFYQYAQWKKAGVLPAEFRRLAINISPLQFAQESFVEHINEALQQAGISGEHIELEITENLLLENVAGAVEKMHRLKESQIKISIDDFGTGYSSLRYLKHLAVDVLKIDRSFVTQLHLDDNDQAIVDTIIMIAHRLGLEVIAEGVEDVFELNALKQLGCQQFQGFLFDQPLPANVITQRFADNHYQSLLEHALTAAQSEVFKQTGNS